MNKKLLLLFITITYLPTQANLKNPQYPQPEFKDSIYLFQKRNLIEQLEIEETLKKELSDESLVSKIIHVLSSVITSKKISDCLKGPQVAEIAHHPARKKSYSLELTTPTNIVLTFSGKKTLADTVKTLKNQCLAHNFIIDTDGSIYPVTSEGETVQEALRHRPFALGIAGKVVDGLYEERDMNATSLSISVVGLDSEKATEEQEKALIKTISWLKKTYNIASYNVVDYGTIALPYGRRKTQENLPWEKLASHGLTIWPRISTPLIINYCESNIVNLEDIRPECVSAALRKLGYLTPITIDENNPVFKQAVITFQKHYKCAQTDGTITYELVFIIKDLLQQVESENPALKNIWPPAQ